MIFTENPQQQPLILIVDDKPENIQVLVSILREHYRIKAATDGILALHLAQSDEQPDLIILDVLMPQMDGFEVCKKLKRNPHTKDIPIMFITALESPSAEFEGLQLEAMDYITKPVNPSTLRMRVRNLVKLKQMHDTLVHLSNHDGLTGLANRRHFDAFIDSEWRRALRSGTAIGLAMFDIDHFKLFNDHYGHQAGDLCLQQVAKILSSVSLRAGDLAARYGGEEFSIIVPSSDIADLRTISETCRVGIEALAIPHELSPHKVVTISCGIHMLIPSASLSVAQLIRLADQNLYLAKKSGRNRVNESD
ncbi:MAG: diguanylate cyclase [Mariprofundus sp.]|nr:diguanylate cyclase [Mariprofundus sp.]